MRKIIAIDFDDTIFNTNYPEIGSPKWRTIERAKAEKRKGAALILWTCRTGEALEEAVEACKRVGLVFDAVNENLEEMIDLFNGDTRKIVADEYWDDKAVKI